MQRLKIELASLTSQRDTALGGKPQESNAQPSAWPVLSLDGERRFLINDCRCMYGKKGKKLKPIQAPKGNAKPSREATLLMVAALRSSSLPARIPRSTEWLPTPQTAPRVKQALPPGVSLIGEGDRQRLSPRVDLSEEVLAIAKAHRLG